MDTGSRWIRFNLTENLPQKPSEVNIGMQQTNPRFYFKIPSEETLEGEKFITNKCRRRYIQVGLGASKTYIGSIVQLDLQEIDDKNDKTSTIYQTYNTF